MKTHKAILLFFLLTLIPQLVVAHGDDDRQPAPVYNSTSITNNAYYKDGALSLAMAAAGMNAYWSTNAWQVSMSYGNMAGYSSGMVGIAKRPCETCPLFQGIVSQAETSKGMVNGVGVSMLWLFKN